MVEQQIWTAPPLAPGRRLRDDPVFRRYWAAHSVNSAGSTITLVALPILMFQTTGSALLTALLDSVYIAPYLLLGLFVGALADRADRRWLMIGCDAASALALASIPVASALGSLTTAHLLVATALAGVGFVGFDAAQWGALPSLVGRDRAVPAISSLGAVDSTLAVAGTAAAGALAAAIGAAAAIWFDAASFVASAVLLTTVRGSFGPGSGSECRAGLRADVVEGVRFMWRHRLIRALTLGGTAASLTSGAVLGLLVVFSVRALGLGSHDARLGLLFSAGGLGALLATGSLSRLTRRYDIPRLNLVSRTASVLLVVVFAAQHQYALALLVYVAFSFADMLAIRSAIAFRQLNTPDHLQGRVNVVARMTALAGQPVGAALGGALAEVGSVRDALLIMSSALAVSALAGWLGPARSVAVR